MKRILACIFIASMASAAFAQHVPEINSSNPNARMFMMRGYAKPGGGGGSGLIYHNGGVVIRNAKVVFIFWGSAFASGGQDAAYASELQAFRNQFGTTGEYNTITQYYGEDPVSGYGNIAQASLAGSQADWFDTTNPVPTNVTDSAVQAEVQRYLAGHGGANFNTVYEVFIPRTSFSSYGSQGSCGATGGVSLAYCAYHSDFSVSGGNVKYSIEPYPSCSGCQVSGWSAAKNQEHFVTHETREAVTDALGNAWFDRRGYEADDKCAWSPSPFIGTGGYGYQYEWSNANNGCVKTR